MEFQPGASCSWIIRTIFKNRDVICQTQVWNKIILIISSLQVNYIRSCEVVEWM